MVNDSLDSIISKTHTGKFVRGARTRSQAKEVKVSHVRGLWRISEGGPTFKRLAEVTFCRTNNDRPLLFLRASFSPFIPGSEVS